MACLGLEVVQRFLLEKEAELAQQHIHQQVADLGYNRVQCRRES